MFPRKWYGNEWREFFNTKVNLRFPQNSIYFLKLQAYYLKVMRMTEEIKKLSVIKYPYVIYIEIKHRILRTCVLNKPKNFSKTHLLIYKNKEL